MFSLINILQIVIIFQGSLLAIFIIVKSKNRFKRDLFLALLLGTLSLQILGMFLINRNFEPELLSNFNAVYLFLYGPFLYLYSLYVTFSDFKFKPFHLLHFLPFIVVLLSMVIINDNLITQTKIYIAYSVSVLSYIFVCFLQLKKFQKIIKDNYSKLEFLNLKWLRWTLIIFSLIVLIDGIQIATIMIAQNGLRLEIIVFLLILAVINLLYFNGYMRNDTSLQGFDDEDLALSESISTRKRQDTQLSENRSIIERLEAHLSSTESFKNPNLTIGLLSEEIDIPKRTLSELINDHYDQNFVDFINTYRINCAKQQLLNPKDSNETIQEVMYDVGFNSKSSFNAAFKNKTGITPSNYKSN